jgi:hypothetical protein
MHFLTKSANFVGIALAASLMSLAACSNSNGGVDSAAGECVDLRDSTFATACKVDSDCVLYNPDKYCVGATCPNVCSALNYTASANKAGYASFMAAISPYLGDATASCFCTQEPSASVYCDAGTCDINLDGGAG